MKHLRHLDTVILNVRQSRDLVKCASDHRGVPLNLYAVFDALEEALAHLEDKADALKSGPSGPAAIETAPRDGTFVLAWTGCTWRGMFFTNFRWTDGEFIYCPQWWRSMPAAPPGEKLILSRGGDR